MLRDQAARRDEIQASTSLASQPTERAPNLRGFGNSPLAIHIYNVDFAAPTMELTSD